MEKGGRGFNPLGIFFTIAVVLLGIWVARNNPANWFPSQEHEQPNEIISPAQSGRQIDLRMDKVRISDIHDPDGVGEFTLRTLAVRRYEESAELRYPPEGHAQSVRPNEVVDLGDFSLTVHNVRDDEAIHVYFLALELDDQSASAEAATDVAIAGLVQTLQLLLTSGGVLPQTIGEVVQLGGLGDVTADWLRQAEMLGFYYVVLTPQNGWLADQQLETVTTDGNMQLQYSVLASNSSFAGGTSPQQPSGSSSQNQPSPAATQPPSLVLTSPIYGEYKNAIPFKWTGDPNGQYIVYLRHAEPESTNYHTSGAITGLSWEFHIPKEQYGYWEVFVTTADGLVRSETVTFIFNPNPAD